MPIGSSSENTVMCDSCGCANAAFASYCSKCGGELFVSSAPLTAVRVGADGALISDEAPLMREPLFQGPNEPESYAVSLRHESLLAKLDRMEQDLASINDIREPDLTSEDDEDDDEQADFGLHEEALKNISYTLDSLITDLLEAEIKEYTFPDFIHPDESGFPLKDAIRVHKEPDLPKKKSLQEILVIVALVAAIFMVGLSFGLWGAYFFGL
jgi:hypothetical protein